MRTENIFAPSASSEHIHVIPQSSHASGRGEHMSKQRKRNTAKCYRDNTNLR